MVDSHQVDSNLQNKNDEQSKNSNVKSVKSNFIKIPDNFEGYDISQFCIVKHYSDVLESVIVPNGMIKDRIEKLALDISSDIEFSGNGIATLCVLKGGFKFFADLMSAIDSNNRTRVRSVPMSVEFIKVKSYENESSTGYVQILGIDDLSVLKGKSVLIVEDIIDTGRTMRRLEHELQQYRPAAIKVATLLLKRTPRSTGFVPDYVGFEVPDKFLVGYAMDYNEYFRDLGHLCICNEEGKKRYQV